MVEDEAIRGDFEMKWAVILLAVLFGCTLVAESTTLVHVKTGQYLAGHGFLPPAKDVFSSTASDRPWINGDGVVNTYDYQRMFLSGQDALGEYLRANRVTHVVFELPRGAAIGPELRFTAFGLLYQRSASVALAPGDIVLRRAVARGPAQGEDVLVVRWRR